MKKLITVSIFTLTAFLLLLLTCGFILSRFIDPNKYKGRISQYVYAKTGQVLVINGAMEWSVFPWIGLKANKLEYYNPPSFVPKKFVSAKEMDIKIKMIPLVRGNIEVGNITLDGVVLNLIKNKDGVFNWQTAEAQNNQTQEVSTAKKTNTLSNLSIRSLKIKNGKLNYFDKKTNSQISISNLNIGSNSIRFNHAFPLEIQFDLLNDRKLKELTLDLKTQISMSADYQHYDLQNIRVRAVSNINDKPLTIKGEGHLESNLDTQTLKSNLKLMVGNVNGNLDVLGTNISKQPHYSGDFSTEHFNAKEFLQTIGHPIQTKNKKSLQDVALNGKFILNGSNLTFNSVQTAVDKSHFYADATLSSQAKVLSFNAKADDIAIDDFVPEASSHPDTKADTSFPTIAKLEKNKKPNSTWKIDGKFNIGHIKADKLELSNFRGHVRMANNVIYLDPMSANIYGGILQGAVSIDSRQPSTVFAIKQTITGLNIRDLLQVFSSSDKLSGSANITANLTAVTNNRTTFLEGLNGNLKLVILDGSLHGIDIIYQLSRAHAFIKHLPTAHLTDSKQTQFTQLQLNGVVNKGVITVDDLDLASAYLKVNGKGMTNLVNHDIKYKLNALAQPRLAAENNQIGKDVTIYQVPIKISGKLTKPSVNVDMIELAKLIYTKDIQKPVSEHLGKNINHLKDDLKDQVNQKIQNINPKKLLNKWLQPHDSKASEQGQQ